MTLRFSGMDPYIEAQAWEDFHSSFLGCIRDALVKRVRPNYVVHVEKRVYVELDPGNAATSYIADAAIFRTDQQSHRSSEGLSKTSIALMDEQTDINVGTATVPMPQEHRESFLVIRRPREAEVITVVELLSPTNKRLNSEGRRIYLEKRIELQEIFVLLYERAGYDYALDYRQPLNT